MAKALALFLLLVSFFSVFAEETETLPHAPLPSPEASPPHYHHHHPHPHPHTPPLSPTPAPAPVHTPTISHPPAHPPHHHHHHHPHPHPPAPAPVKPPVQPPTPAPAKPPAHHYPPTPAPVKPPTHHHYPPTPAPVKPPTPHHHYPPTPTPTPAPVPVHPFPRSFVAVQGVVYNKSCKYAGLDTLLGATPVLGAVVKLECNNTKYRLVQTGKTDKNGYFYLEAPKTITTYGAHKCKVFLISAPTGLKPSNFHGGVTGSLLKPEKPFVSQKKLPFLLFSVGPFAFEPKCPR